MVANAKTLSISSFITLLTVVSAAIYEDACDQAFNECDFTFEGVTSVPTFNIGGTPDTVFTPMIISKDPNERIGVLNTNDIAPEFILADGTALPITLFGIPPFTPTHFKPLFIPNTSSSGVGYQTFDGNQLQVARGQCVRLFFTSFQLFVGPPEDVRNIEVDRYDFKCVVFRTAKH